MRLLHFLLPVGILGACGGKILDKSDAEPPPTTTTVPTTPPTPPPTPTKPPPPPPPGGCSPEDVTGFAPPALHGLRVKTSVCTQTQIDSYYASCLDLGASSAKCSQFNVSNKACAACIISNKTDALWGPLIQGKGLINPNVAGCVVLVTGDASSSSCAHFVQALSDCTDAACSANCPVTDNASFAEYRKCTETAKVGGCNSFNTAAQCINSAPQSKCAPMLTDFKTAYDIVVPMFCL